jgi:hypothetical protein
MIGRTGIGRTETGRVAWAAAVAVIVAAAAAAAAERPAVTVGFAGAYRAGAWTPVVVSGSAAGAPERGAGVHVWAQDPDGQFVRSPPARIAERADGAGIATARVRFGRPAGRLRIESGGAGGAGEEPRFVEVDLPPAIPATDRALLLIGDLPALEPALQRAWQATVRSVPGAALTRSDAASSGPRAWVVRTDGAAIAGAGDEPRDFDMFEAIVVCGRSLPRADPALLAGIDAWVRRGGRLVVAAGASAATIPPDSLAGGWLPGAVTRVITLRGPRAVEAWVRAGRLPDRAEAIRVPLFADPQALPGVIERIDDEAAAGMPLVVRRAHGLGTLTWLGLDVDAEPFRDWPGSANLVATLLGERQATGAASASDGLRGVPDLAGQLRVALERSAPGSDRPPAAPLPFELAIGLGILYVLCLYPLDWWLVSRGMRRAWLGWLSLPAIVAGFTLLTWGIAARRSAPEGGSRFAAAVTDIDAATGLVRGHSWSGIHVPGNGAVAVTLEVEPTLGTVPTDRAISWLADAGTGLGAIDASTAHPALTAADYSYGESLATLERVPIAAGATRLFEGEWFGAHPTPVVSGTLSADVQGTLRGSFAHHLPFPLEDCQLLHGNWLYDVGRLAPGAALDLATGRGPRSLQAAVTRRRASTEREQLTPWDPTGTDVERILEVAGLFAAAGGTGYTGLGPGRLRRLDLTTLAGLDRALLVGRAAEPATAWDYSSGRVAPRGRYRIVIPVDRAGDPSRPSSSANAQP